MHDRDSVLAVLEANAWPAGDHDRALAAATLSLTVYGGRTRDQGTPYIEHPLAVVAILRDELHVTRPGTLILGLLHDALEVSPSSEPEIITRLGRLFVEELRALTPDHRLEDRPKRATDETLWRAKMQRLSPDGLLIRFADRIHNLRDLRRSPDTSRHRRFIAQLADFYLPLAKAAQMESAQLKAAYELLLGEYDRYRSSGMARI
ncbi:HD domain-containing protein [Nonomuraea phyllanthi]|uniref:HD domain-containing protein n=1 Tax=Nonomuraea phyllanthi TaxID=2219224 RepID=UPI0012936DFE|nr:HD domain-containing protein [Nonomuraea phyllanthi]QFY13724.1 HD domain-containing protein [Nonomuraea phyllanthi]